MLKLLYVIVLGLFCSHVHAADYWTVAQVYNGLSLPLPTDSFKLKAERGMQISELGGGELLFKAFFCCCASQHSHNLRSYYCQEARPVIESIARDVPLAPDFISRFDTYTALMLDKYTHAQESAPEDPWTRRCYSSSVASLACACHLLKAPPVSDVAAMTSGVCIGISLLCCGLARLNEVIRHL
jgi:hypothetical protein